MSDEKSKKSVDVAETLTTRRSRHSKDYGVAKPKVFGLGDFLIAAFLGVATFFFQMLWEYPGVYPGAWDGLAVAFGVRPATSIIPGYWTAIVTGLYQAIGDGMMPVVLRLAGHVILAIIAIATYSVIRELLVFSMRARPQRSRRRTMVMRLAAALSATAFIAMDPIWTAGQCFSELEIMLLLSLGALETFFVFLRKGSIKWGYLMAIILGLLAAESAIGFAMLFVFLGLNCYILKVMPAMDSPFFKPAVIAVGKWHLTFLFLFSFLVGIGIDCFTFLQHDGLMAVGGSVGDVPLKFVKAYIATARGAATLPGWLLWVGVCLAPFLVSIFRFPPAADEERFLTYSTGMVFFACGLIAFTQCCSLPAVWFWTYFPLNSEYLMAIGLLMCALTFSLAITILGVDSLCRNHLRLTRVLLGYDDDDDNDEDLLKGRRLSNFMRRACLILIPMLVVGAMVPGRVKTGVREMLVLIEDAIGQIVTDADGLRYLVTDGRLDVGVELESARRGKRISCISLIKDRRYSDAVIRHLNTRGMADDAADMASFGYDVGMGMRSWIHDRPAKLENCAVQLGFDLWKREGKPFPPMGGMMARPGGWETKGAHAQADSVAAARALATRILALYAKGGVSKCGDATVRGVFESVAWRIARMCTYRGDVADLAGDVKTAIAEAAMAKELNDRNGAYHQTMAAFRKANELMMKRLTPREGLQLALVRADFSAGKHYAETILSVEPEDPDANFSMGMYYLKDQQYSRAAEYLRRCLVKRPEEPAIYNNLAMIDLTLGKLDEAEVNVAKALKLKPDSAAIKDTKRAIEKARDARAKGDK